MGGLRLFSSEPPPKTEVPWHASRYVQLTPAPLSCLVGRKPSSITKTIPSGASDIPISPPIRSSLKRKRTQSEVDQPAHRKRRSVSSSSGTSSASIFSFSGDESNGSSTGPSTPPSDLSFFSCNLLTPRFVDWAKFGIPTVPQIYGIR
ncbi:hypothetical protein AN958_06328 [Leucoagaricus sp. SymC.cos]|nr:hypothetical protein AN958_06328 [Leucoagaricus sp. SymC.cos]